MRLPRWLKKPQAQQPSTIIKPDGLLSEKQLDDIIDELEHEDTPVYSHGIPNAIPLTPSRQIPVTMADDEPVPAQPPQAPPVDSANDSPSPHATMAIAKVRYRESVRTVLANKLRSL